jgi:hypothetical protein
MVPTDELRTKLRRLVDESIPAGGTDGDTRFLDTEIDDILTGSENVLYAASQGWTEKAGKIGDELGQMVETQAGDERHKRVALKDALEYCLGMAKVYEVKGDKAKAEEDREGSRLLGFQFPCPRPGEPR